MRSHRYVANLGAAFAVAIGMTACGSGSSPTAPANKPPAGSVAVVPATPALLAVTTVHLSAAGTDPEGDALTYAWNFGDGLTASGADVTHVFTAAGTLNVVLTLTDSKGAQSTASKAVVVKSLTGRWIDTDPHFKWDFVQSGNTFTGDATDGINHVGDGQLGDPRTISFDRLEGYLARGLPSSAGVYAGTLDESLDHINVVYIPNFRFFNLTRR